MIWSPTRVCTFTAIFGILKIAHPYLVGRAVIDLGLGDST